MTENIRLNKQSYLRCDNNFISDENKLKKMDNPVV